MNKKVEKFYDEFAKKQVKTGVNLRHYQILRYAIDFGLQRSHSVLEIGCGIGTFTGLLASYLSDGEVYSTDISEESIRVAKERLVGKRNIVFDITNMSNFSVDRKFDFVILPDVLEHIPIDQHKNLFDRISVHMHSDSKILIHIPHPQIIEYYHRVSPEVLQVIDQPIHTDVLAESMYFNDLIIQDIKSYSLFHKQVDYQLIVAEKKRDKDYFEPRSKLSISLAKMLCRLSLLFS